MWELTTRFPPFQVLTPKLEVQGEMSALLPPTCLSSTKSVEPRLEYAYGFVGNGTQSMDQNDYLVQQHYSLSEPNLGGGELMFGGGRSYAAQAGVGISSDSFIDEAAAAYLRRELSIMLELENDDARELEASHEWSGVMGFSRDDYPWVGEINEEIVDGGGEGLWICGGYTGNGMPNAWLCGKAVIDLIVGKHDVDIDLPVEYRVSKERVEKARRDHDEVWIADQDFLRSDPIPLTTPA